ncbi:hypothetical protein [Halanaerobium congolense]|uniref:hypothetical protein n=1 Tax=Halanaerobium congolense TaxID=54121 RepID=UPI000B08BC0B|nr:hypothetical protein [Halanaerobium congolense]
MSPKRTVESLTSWPSIITILDFRTLILALLLSLDRNKISAGTLPGRCLISNYSQWSFKNSAA